MSLSNKFAGGAIIPNRISNSGSELFIVDNSDEAWKVVRYLHDWCQISKAFDIATGYFEIGSLLALGNEWQKVDKIRILMGDEVSKRTFRAFEKGLQEVKGRLDASLNREKENNDFLDGVPAIVEAIRSKKIECRVYRKEKFHAKAYITHARLEVVGSFALVGSSNFTFPGLNENIELNVQITGKPVSVLQEWYDEHWNNAEDVSLEVLQTIERHTRDYLPFEVFAKSLQEFFRGHEMTVGEWESTQSKMYPILDQYQKDGYQALMKIAGQYNGAFLCDGVGLGKTFVGLMLIERLVVHDRKRVLLLVPKSGRDDVWEPEIRRHLRQLSGGDFSGLVILNHTDLLRGGKFPDRFKRLKEVADVIIIDEAHHFRNPGSKGDEGEFKSRYWRLCDIAKDKSIFMLTATPINNKLIDLQHMIELFSRRQQNYFSSAPLGIHSLAGHFRKLENALEKELESNEYRSEGETDVLTNESEAEKILWNDSLFRALVVQRSRSYVKKSQEQNGGSNALFPVRENPKVAEYNLKKTYGPVLGLVEKAFKKDKPLFILAIYYPLAYYKGPDIEKQKRAFDENRQKEVVGLIRIMFLKRFESSAKAFEFSCEALMLKLLAWVSKHSKTDSEKKRYAMWLDQNAELIEYVRRDQRELSGDLDEVEDDVIPEELLEKVQELSREEYNIEDIISETYLDLSEIATFLNELKKFKPENDDKLQTLISLLKNDPVLKKHKVLIFSEFMATARYLKKELRNAGIDAVDEVDSASHKDRSAVIRAFAPYYNGVNSITDKKTEKEIRVLISTDVLSEGLNLQDATRLINYDIHWNPVRLMQRIGRVDRRLNPVIEKQIIADHPDQEEIRGKVAYWNFLPPDELDNLLNVYKRVAHKTLRISKVFGIEGKKLLRPEDNFEALKEFNETYEGSTTALETMHLEFRQLLMDHPDLEKQLNGFPSRIFSGKEHPKKGSRAVFFCYALPAPMAKNKDNSIEDASVWTEEAGFTKWFLFDLATSKILEEPTDIIDLIRSTPETPRNLSIEKKTLSEIRGQMDRHIKNTYLKQVQAPIGVKPVLKTWMELS